MKFAINHPEDFKMPTLAALLAFQPVLISMLLTFAIVMNILD